MVIYPGGGGGEEGLLQYLGMEEKFIGHDPHELNLNDPPLSTGNICLSLSHLVTELDLKLVKFVTQIVI